MATASTVERFLIDHKVPYHVIPHEHSSTSLQAARAAKVPARRLAKAVLLEDGEHFVMAVVPSTCHLDLEELSQQLGRRLALAAEPEAEEIFSDCERGALPALGPAYGLETVWDERLLESPELYFEGGDHEHLVHVATRDYLGLLKDCPRGSFTHPV
ncbi:MAG TPA: YbaK/EbsC family protein [Steroidobacteraceae bacterium]|nr:YbaK/EbsC family protein [Steroidobacteraceae bacterium]